MKTSVAYPYALVVSNSGTKLAFLTDCLANGGYRGHHMNRHWSHPEWSALFKTPASIAEERVIRRWRHPPSAASVKAAAKAFNKRQRAA